MVGWGGFGAAKAGAAIMVRAAAKEPAMVALAKAFLELMEVILSRESGVAGGGDDEGSSRPDASVTNACAA